VLNVRFTKDLARHEADIRTIWGGALCVSKALHTLAELIRVDAAKAGVRGVRHFLTALCALFSVAPYLRPHALAELAIAVWAGAGLMALVCVIEERRLGRVRIRELAKLGL